MPSLPTPQTGRKGIMKTITEWRVTFETDHEQYWQGHGLAFTDYEDTGIGCGETLAASLSDALESLAQQDYDIPSSLKAEIKAELASQVRKPHTLETPITILCEHPELTDDEEVDCAICAGDWHYYVMIDVK